MAAPSEEKEEPQYKRTLCPTVLCGPSGVGKGTLLRRVRELLPNTIGVAVSHTTRKPRKGEVDGVHYHYTTRDDFEANMADFVEHADVNGNYYGTSKTAIGDVAPLICVLEIDVQGAVQIKKAFRNVRFLFVTTKGGIDTLKTRLQGRKTETQDQIARRLATAEKELKFLDENEAFFDCVLSNDDLEPTAMSLARQFVDWYPWITTDRLSVKDMDNDDDKQDSAGLVMEYGTVETLFNALQFDTLVVDLRSAEENAKASVCGSVVLDVDDNGNIANLEKLKRPRVFAYGGSEEKQKQLFAKTAALKGVQFCVIQDAFEQFQKSYPFLCKTALQDSPERVEYPNVCPTTNGRIFVGGLAHAESPAVIKNLGITHIVNTKGVDSKLPADIAKGIKYHMVKIEDEEKESVLPLFEASSKFVEDALLENGDNRVLIHCGGGKSRSTTFTMAYLISKQKQSLAQAYGNVSRGRPKAYPNDGFLDELERLEVDAHGTSSKTFIAGSKLRDKARWKAVLSTWGIK